ncbi:MAG TPA: hypothetical protein VFI66_02480 [Gemmatimonadales bacterium]|nr:hypothetical protein [Gemmatimonadales bacterium]
MARPFSRLERFQLGDERPELELREQLREPPDVGRADTQGLEVERQRHVTSDGHELA